MPKQTKDMKDFFECEPMAQPFCEKQEQSCDVAQNKTLHVKTTNPMQKANGVFARLIKN